MCAINKHNIRVTIGITRLIDIPCFDTVDTSVNCSITNFHQILTTKTCFLRDFVGTGLPTYSMTNSLFLQFSWTIRHWPLLLELTTLVYDIHWWFVVLDIWLFSNKEEYIQHPGKVGLSLLEQLPPGMLSFLGPAVQIWPSSWTSWSDIAWRLFACLQNYHRVIWLSSRLPDFKFDGIQIFGEKEQNQEMDDFWQWVTCFFEDILGILLLVLWKMELNWLQGRRLSPGMTDWSNLIINLKSGQFLVDSGASCLYTWIEQWTVQWKVYKFTLPRARAMRARAAVVVVGGGGKDAILAAAINHHHHQQCRHWHRWLNPTAAAVDNDRYRCRRQLPLPMPHSQWQGPPEASGHCLLSTAAMGVIVDRSGSQWNIFLGVPTYLWKILVAKKINS